MRLEQAESISHPRAVEVTMREGRESSHAQRHIETDEASMDGGGHSDGMTIIQVRRKSTGQRGTPLAKG